MKKRWIAAFLAMVLSLSMLAGCGAEQAVSGTNSDLSQIADTMDSDAPSQSGESEEAVQTGDESAEEPADIKFRIFFVIIIFILNPASDPAAGCQLQYGILSQ